MNGDERSSHRKDPRSLTWENTEVLFAPFLSFTRVLLAVSGGSDSLALLYLASQWAQRHQNKAPQFEVGTVDHGLRAGSRAEALEVKRHAEICGFAYHLLEWTEPKPQHGLQARAREARYALLERLARTWKDEGVALATAHTCEDQAETVLMRLARGSGPDGLRGIASRRPLHPSSNIFLLRPLLGVSRADLKDWLSAHGCVWAEDPSNEDERFERVKLRHAAPLLQRLGLQADKLALVAQRQARAVAALEEATGVLQKTCLRVHEGAYGSLHREPFEQAPHELRVRLLLRVLKMFGGESPAADLEQVERMVGELEKKPLLRWTLGGCVVHAKKDLFLFYREVGRASLVPTPLLPGVPLLWDQRFRISLLPRESMKDAFPQSSHLMVRPLDLSVFRKLRDSGEKKFAIPARAAATLPAVWSGDTLITIGGLRAHTKRAEPSFSSTDLPIRAEFVYSEEELSQKPSFTMDPSEVH